MPRCATFFAPRQAMSSFSEDATLRGRRKGAPGTAQPFPRLRPIGGTALGRESRSCERPGREANSYERAWRKPHSYDPCGREPRSYEGGLPVPHAPWRALRAYRMGDKSAWRYVSTSSMPVRENCNRTSALLAHPARMSAILARIGHAHCPPAPHPRKPSARRPPLLVRPAGYRPAAKMRAQGARKARETQKGAAPVGPPLLVASACRPNVAP